MTVPSLYSSINNGDDDMVDAPEEGDAEESFKVAEDALKELELEENMTKGKQLQSSGKSLYFVWITFHDFPLSHVDFASGSEYCNIDSK